MAAAKAPINLTATHTPEAAAVGLRQHSPWHSPVPYLFGGLAAMLGLIAFALLILACSYWKLSGHVGGDGERDLEAGGGGEEGNKAGEGGDKQGVQSFAEKFLVIMAGEKKPTFLATPMSSRSSSFGDTCSSSSSNNGEKSCSCGEKNEKVENGTIGVESMKQGNIIDNHHLHHHHQQEQNGNMGSN